MPIVNHEYPVVVSYQGGRDGRGEIANEGSGQSFEIAVPPEFGGNGGATNPEELLTSAIAGCFSITYGIVATTRRLPFLGVQTSAVGTVEQNGINFVYKTITIRPLITLAADATDEQIKLAEEVAHKADQYCIVTNAVREKVTVTIEPTVALA